MYSVTENFPISCVKILHIIIIIILKLAIGAKFGSKTLELEEVGKN
jgi:hypothetical protein